MALLSHTSKPTGDSRMSSERCCVMSSMRRTLRCVQHKAPRCYPITLSHHLPPLSQVLEAVIRLETARDAEAAGRAMPLEETLYSSACDPGDPFVCLPDAIRALQTLAKLGGRRRSR